MSTAPTLSTGQPSTLGTYHDLCSVLFGEGSAATKFFADKIAKQGRDEPVLTPESQMMFLIQSMI